MLGVVFVFALCVAPCITPVAVVFVGAAFAGVALVGAEPWVAEFVVVLIWLVVCSCIPVAPRGLPEAVASKAVAFEAVEREVVTPEVVALEVVTPEVRPEVVAPEIVAFEVALEVAEVVATRSPLGVWPEVVAAGVGAVPRVVRADALPAPSAAPVGAGACGMDGGMPGLPELRGSWPGVGGRGASRRPEGGRESDVDPPSSARGTLAAAGSGGCPGGVVLGDMARSEEGRSAERLCDNAQ